MTSSINTEKTSKKGRPFKDPVSKCRTLLWYWAIRQKSGLSDGKLDIEFSDIEPDVRKTGGGKRNYEDRVRVFEDLRKSGATISGGKHKRRNFDLVQRVDDHANLNGSAELYQSVFWEIIGDTKPTVEKTKDNFLELIKKCDFNNVKLYKYSQPSLDELKKLSALVQKTPEEIAEILEPEIFTNESKDYDEILQSFSNVRHFHAILKEVDFKDLSRYLNILAFYISFYRYAMLTANFHGLVSVADSINEHLSLLLEIKWLEKDFTRELFHLIYSRIFQSGKNNYDQLNTRSLSSEIGITTKDTAIYRLLALLND